MSKIGGYTSFDVGFQKNIYEKANAATTRDAKHSESVGMAYIQRDMSKTRSVCEWHRGIWTSVLGRFL